MRLTHLTMFSIQNEPLKRVSLDISDVFVFAAWILITENVQDINSGERKN